jgi:hypothetical protein
MAEQIDSAEGRGWVARCGFTGRRKNKPLAGVGPRSCPGVPTQALVTTLRAGGAMLLRPQLANF